MYHMVSSIKYINSVCLKLCSRTKSTDSLNQNSRERSGSVVESLTQDREVANSSLTDVTCVVSLSKTYQSLLGIGSNQDDLSKHN